MRILAAPDSFTGTMSASAAATAMVDGWLDTWEKDVAFALPLSDGGPGFTDAIVAARGAQRVTAQVRGPMGESVEAQYALAGPRAWIESAAACGLALVPAGRRDPMSASTYGVGELVSAAIAAGATDIMVGLGGSATCDGGAGLLAALGATCHGGALDQGGGGLATVESVDLDPALGRLFGVRLTIASDVDNVLVGPRGAAHVYGPQKGATPDQVVALDAGLTRLAQLCGRLGTRDPAVALGAGAAGGLGYGLLRLGATRVAGIATVLDELSARTRMAEADVVITGEGCLDDQSLHGKVVAGVARLAADVGVPCIAVAGEVRLGKRELAAAGIDAAYSLRELVGPAPALESPLEALRVVTARVARTWGRAR